MNNFLPYPRGLYAKISALPGSLNVAHTIISVAASANTSGSTLGATAEVANGHAKGHANGHANGHVGEEEGIELNMYKPHDKASNGVVVYLHGGGWTYFTARQYHSTVSYIADYCKITVVSVDYRKAPEDPFPAGLIDCYDGLLWVQRNSKELGVDADKVFVMGDSAGGNLAAAVCLLHRDKRGLGLDGTGSSQPPPAAQIMIYPCLQGHDFQKGSYHDNKNNGLSREGMATYTSLYLTSKLDHPTFGKPDLLPPLPTTPTTPYLHNTGEITDIYNPYVFPLAPADLTHLPPAYIMIARFDVLRDDGERYAQRLEESGNKVVLSEDKGGVHGFMLNYHQTPHAKVNLMKIKDFMDSLMSEM